jgi:hypothetical protein
MLINEGQQRQQQKQEHQGSGGMEDIGSRTGMSRGRKKEIMREAR